jgi:diguanylate cyclase (GGDEF)-like protein
MKKMLTLFAALRRANLGGALVGMITAGLTLSVLTFFSLRAQVNANLDLVARTIAYSTEAALMFNDKITTHEILQRIAQQENLETATVSSHTGEVLAHLEQPDGDTGSALRQFINRQVFPAATTAPVVSTSGQIIGTVSIRSNGAIFAAFFMKMASAITLSLLLTGLATLLFTRNTEQKIASQLDTLSKNILMRNKLRSHEGMHFQIAEFHHINTQFENMLMELDAKNAELVAHQMNLENVNASLNYKANHDELTGLANRTYFSKCLDLAISHAQAELGQLAVLYLDSDRFKAINDQYGHAVGDMYLVEMAQSIRKAVRRSDIVARLGGDEFAVLLAPLETPGIAQRVAENILTSPELLILNNGQELSLKLCVSIGIACFPDTGHDSNSLLLAADHAMYAAKNGGGQRYHFAASPATITE